MIKKEKKHKIKRNKAGVTLIELLVSVTLFVILMLSTTEIFHMVLRHQRHSIATQNVQEGLKYFFEVASKEIRMAKRNPSSGDNCLNIVPGKLFKVEEDNTKLHLRNYRDECVTYYLENGRFMIEREGVSVPLTPKAVNIDNIYFNAVEEEDSQPYIIISVLAESFYSERDLTKIQLQTVVTSRYYRKD